MSSPTKIEWTERTWNPVVGCSLASPGCTNCYAMRTAYRMSKNPKTPQYHGTAKLANGKPVFTGKLALVEKALLEPLKRKTPTTYFVNSMGDLFHEDMPDEWIDRVFAVMALCPQHTFQVLTKRADRMRAYLNDLRTPNRIWNRILGVELPKHYQGDVIHALKNMPLPNVWLGVSVEDQKRANERVPELLATPAAIRFISAEPLLGPVYLSLLSLGPGKYPGLRAVGDTLDALSGEKVEGTQSGYLRSQFGAAIDWVIVGGESGPNARAMHPDWVRSLRDQCKAAGTAFFFKQWGAWTVEIDRDRDDPDWRANYSKAHRDGWSILNLAGGIGFHGERVCLMRRTSKKAAGRLLDGREWNEMPERVAA
ncbi:phage Gp37/Gp68 family protein [Ruegeria sp. Ofav3-42]|uniref:phage Gp37/Gp68 family protein n=1 Tax=Ruegeria sp. Ofav3-42 TaxID=2917759 RepID=UPI001EF40890|nr:phage Gp37/Gp68 family protein [Ruegeria sp. Ofav3-42]MCG7520875.1 phage Gp37/Gp68 family protein [Ruegeria sp. Ofav3-42]